MNVYPYQQRILDHMTKFKGRGIIQLTGRRTGKSAFSAQALQRLIDDIHSRPIEDLKLSEGTVYGSRYFCVEPVGGNWRAMEDWIINTLGPSTGSIWAEVVDKTPVPHPGERWYGNNRKFWFRDAKDRDWFLLKWR